jgi:hypothetical protein
MVAWVGTLATMILACWSGLPNASSHYQARYSPTVALTAATVIAVIWYTYFTQQTLEHTRRTSKNTIDRQRQSLCTAVLSELRDLAPRLRNLRKHGPSAGTPDFFSHPMVKLAAANSALVNANTIQALAEVSRRLSDVQEVLRKYAELDTPLKPSSISLVGVQTAATQKAERTGSVKTRAAWAFNSVVRLVGFLQEEGGKMPTKAFERPVQSFAEIELLPDPFD